MDQAVKTKSFQIHKSKFDAKTRTFEGYASVFGNVDSDNDVVERGAFSKFLAKGWNRVKILALHNDQWLPIGKPLELREDEYGLFIRAELVDTSLGLDMIKLLQAGVIDEMSIGFILLDSWLDEDGIQHITEVELQEVSLVTWAANSMAKVLDIKSRKPGQSEIAKLQSDLDRLQKTLNGFKTGEPPQQQKRKQAPFVLKSKIKPKMSN